MSSTVDLVLLGIVYDRPRSAYDIQKHIEYRNLSYWVKVSTPSVYKRMIVLEKNGYLDKEIIKNGKNPEKTIYQITENGKEYFHSMMLEYSQKSIQVIFDFNAVIVGLNKVSKEEALQYVENIYFNINQSLVFIKMIIEQKQDVPIVGKTIMQQQKQVLESLQNWCHDFKNELLECEELEKMKEL
ncbi:PadR family transcriptional regulator [Candidatus Stoquefichus massiliensis]|uniref:PadR family transcriptional regulator n=1 Tax=Candidatus Stoquefichus massiliensis TaxID=1470350 RepID=UPI000483AC45|nr:PadR family transcriptional regulator [Candidatus Stoquefichus massiliensis]